MLVRFVCHAALLQRGQMVTTAWRGIQRWLHRRQRRRGGSRIFFILVSLPIGQLSSNQSQKGRSFRHIQGRRRRGRQST